MSKTISFLPSMMELLELLLTKTPAWVRLWVFFGLMVPNMFVPLVYWEHDIAKIVFGVFNVGAIIMALINAQYGYVKLLGLGHTLWLFMVPYIYLEELNKDDYSSEMKTWLTAVVILNSLSLVLDIFDVWSYVVGGNRDQAFVGVKLMSGGAVELRQEQTTKKTE